MSLELRGGVYYVRTMVDGKRVQKSTRTSDKKVAEAIHKKIMAELVLGHHGMTKAKVPTLREAYDAAMRSHFAGTKSRTTVAINYKTLERILGGTTRLDEIDPSQVVSAMMDEGAAPATINRKLALLSKLLKLNAAVLPKLPKIPLQKEYRGRIRYLSKTDEEALWRVLEEKREGNPNDPIWNDLRCLLVVLLDTGMRLGEALSEIRWDDVDPVKGEVHIWRNKGDHPRTIPLTTRALAALRVMGPRMFSGLTKDQVEHRWKQIRAAAGLGDDVVIHTLRHTCATRLVKSGEQLAKVQRWMGHKTIETTLIYSHLDTGDLHGCRDKLEEVYQTCTNEEANEDA